MHLCNSFSSWGNGWHYPFYLELMSHNQLPFRALASAVTPIHSLTYPKQEYLILVCVKREPHIKDPQEYNINGLELILLLSESNRHR